MNKDFIRNSIHKLKRRFSVGDKRGLPEKLEADLKMFSPNDAFKADSVDATLLEATVAVWEAMQKLDFKGTIFDKQRFGQTVGGIIAHSQADVFIYTEKSRPDFFDLLCGLLSAYTSLLDLLERFSGESSSDDFVDCLVQVTLCLKCFSSSCIFDMLIDNIDLVCQEAEEEAEEKVVVEEAEEEEEWLRMEPGAFNAVSNYICFESDETAASTPQLSDSDKSTANTPQPHNSDDIDSEDDDEAAQAEPAPRNAKDIFRRQLRAWVGILVAHVTAIDEMVAYMKQPDQMCFHFNIISSSSATDPTIPDGITAQSVFAENASGGTDKLFDLLIEDRNEAEVLNSCQGRVHCELDLVVHMLPVSTSLRKIVSSTS